MEKQKNALLEEGRYSLLRLFVLYGVIRCGLRVHKYLPFPEGGQVNITSARGENYRAEHVGGEFITLNGFRQDKHRSNFGVI